MMHQVLQCFAAWHMLCSTTTSFAAWYMLCNMIHALQHGNKLCSIVTRQMHPSSTRISAKRHLCFFRLGLGPVKASTNVRELISEDDYTASCCVLSCGAAKHWLILVVMSLAQHIMRTKWRCFMKKHKLITQSNKKCNKVSPPLIP